MQFRWTTGGGCTRVHVLAEIPNEKRERRWWSPRYCEHWVVIVRRGLRRGMPQREHVGSMSAAMEALGIAYCYKSARRPGRDHGAAARGDPNHARTRAGSTCSRR